MPFKTFKNPASTGELTATRACKHILATYQTEHIRTPKIFDKNFSYFDNPSLKILSGGH